MAFKRSAVRSRLSPPRDLEREFRVFFFFAARPRLQRFHDSTLGNGLHEIAQGAFRGNRWGRGNRDFVAFVGIVGFVGMRGIVISLKSLQPWVSLYVRKSWKRWKRGNGLSRLPSQSRRPGLPPQSASLHSARAGPVMQG